MEQHLRDRRSMYRASRRTNRVRPNHVSPQQRRDGNPVCLGLRAYPRNCSTERNRNGTADGPIHDTARRWGSVRTVICQVAWDQPEIAAMRIYLIALALLAGLGAASAEEWPARPIKLIVPYSAGGSGDIVARGLAQKLTESLGRSVVVDDRPGASGNIGTADVAKSPPDGYTL